LTIFLPTDSSEDVVFLLETRLYIQFPFQTLLETISIYLNDSSS